MKRFYGYGFRSEAWIKVRNKINQYVSDKVRETFLGFYTFNQFHEDLKHLTKEEVYDFMESNIGSKT